MTTRDRTSIVRINNANEQSAFSKLLDLENIRTEGKDYLFQPKQFDEEWLSEWKEYIFTLTKNELVLTPFDASYNYNLLNISMKHILEVLTACTDLPPCKQVYEQILKEHVNNMARSCHIGMEDFDAFKDNFDKFLQFYSIRRDYILNNGAEDIELNNDATSQFRASKDHLIFGKMVGDALGLHPTLGALLNPTGGIVGASNSNVFLRSLGIFPSVRKNAITHDATGYLRYYHGIGPGYKYLDAGDIKGRLVPINGVVYGIYLPGVNLLKYAKWKLQEVDREYPMLTMFEYAICIFIFLICFSLLSLIV